MNEERIPIFLTSDDNYAAYLASTIISIVDNTDSPIDFYIVDGGIKDYKKRMISKMQEQWHFGLEFINAESYRNLFPMPAAPAGHITRSAYDRFLMPHMKPELDRAIIMDIDMIVLGDIRKVWETDLEGNLLAAAPDRRLGWKQQDLGISPHHAYFNIGTMLVDFRKWRDEAVLPQLAAIELKFNTQKFYWFDEILLNILLQENHYKKLPPHFNATSGYQYYCQIERKKRDNKELHDRRLSDEEVNQILISHFVTYKPWQVMYFPSQEASAYVEMPSFKDFWHYMKMTPFFEEEYIAFMGRLNGQCQDHISEIKLKVSDVARSTLGKKYIWKRVWYKFLYFLSLGLVPHFRRKARSYKDRYKSL